jgi:hypothetical protein
VEDHFTEDEDAWMDNVLECVIVTNSHLDIIAQEKLMPRYKGVLHSLADAHPTKPCWTPGTKEVASTRFSVYDWLEFYFALNQHMWRTQIGIFINKTYIACAVTFAVTPRPDLVALVMQSFSFHREHIQMRAATVTCDACSKSDVECRAIMKENETGEEETTMHFGSSCASKLQYLHAIGGLISQFRGRDPFNINRCVDFFANLQRTFDLHSAAKFA